MELPIVITDSSNKTKIQSIENGFAHFKAIVKVVSIAMDSPDVRPLSRNETLSGIENRVKRLLNHYHDKNAIFISIQKGTTILDTRTTTTDRCKHYLQTINHGIDGHRI